ncbi:MAG: extracellular solute-binding protein [Treponema sp.]|nr:extracellular solute-binding protein [Treponema sp.]
MPGVLRAAGSQAGARPITWWLPLNNNVSISYANLGDTPFGKGLMERTGTQIKFFHPPSGGSNEQFNLMVADGNLPDLMEYSWLTYPGGPEKAIADRVIIPLNDVFKKYCPNLTAFLKAHPEYDKMIRTDNGNYYCFPMIRPDPKLLNATGLVVRKDWLKELNLAVPTTIDEWYTVLKAFKEKKKGVPLAFESFFLLSHEMPFPYAFNTKYGFYVDMNGKVRLGQVDPGYRDFLATMAKWYKEGLIDPDFSTATFDQVSAKMTSGISGASVGYMASRLGVWNTSGQATNPNFKLVPAPMPAPSKGTISKFSPIAIPYNYAGGCVAITTSCTDIERAARLLDWGYSQEGYLFYNYGIEGESYNMVNGLPVATDLVNKNPRIIGSYARSSYNGPFIQASQRLITSATIALPPDEDAAIVWSIPESLDRVIPPVTPTLEESREYAAIMNDVNTYANEMILKFILGLENLSKWDTYLSVINSLGLPRALEIQNKALDRYNKRTMGKGSL